MNNIIERTWKQGCMVGIEDLRGLTFQNEALAHTFKISGVDTDGNAIALSGTPSGVMLRADNTDVALTCAVSDGCVTAELPAECYDVPGRAGITIFLTSDSKKTAIYAAVVSVARTQSGTAAPGTTASVVDLVNAIETAISQIPASDTNLKGALAATYSNSALYGVGSYAWYDGKLYKCTTAITTAETWNSAHWTEAKLANDVCDLKSALNCLEDYFEYDFDWADGSFSASDGASVNDNYSIRTPLFYHAKPGDIVYCDSVDFGFRVYKYTKSSIDYYDSRSDFIKNGAYKITNDCYIRITAQYFPRMILSTDDEKETLISHIHCVTSVNHGIEQDNRISDNTKKIAKNEIIRIDQNELNWGYGTINSIGSISDDTTTRIRSKRKYITKGTRISITSQFVKFGVFVYSDYDAAEGSLVYSKTLMEPNFEVVIPVEGYMWIVLAKTDDSTLTDYSIKQYLDADIYTYYTKDIDVLSPQMQQYYDISGSTFNVNTDTKISTSNKYKSARIACEEGDLFVLSGTGASSARLYAFVAENGSILEKANSGVVRENIVLTAPANSMYLIVNSTTETLSVRKVCSIKEKIENLTPKKAERLVPVTIMNASFFNTSSTTPSIHYENGCRTFAFYVEDGKTYKVKLTTASSYRVGFVVNKIDIDQSRQTGTTDTDIALQGIENFGSSPFTFTVQGFKTCFVYGSSNTVTNDVEITVTETGNPEDMMNAVLIDSANLYCNTLIPDLIGSPELYISEPTAETETSLNNKTVAELYALYDDLCTRFPKMIKRVNDIGEDETETYGIREYVMTFADPLVTNGEITLSGDIDLETVTNLWKPKYNNKILAVTAGMHGNEKAPTWGLALAIEEILSSNKPFATFIKSNFEVHIIPCINPYGFQNDIRRNANNIDINRDFLNYLYDIENAQAETVALGDWMTSIADKCVAYIDSHGTTGYYAYYEAHSDDPYFEGYCTACMRFTTAIQENWKQFYADHGLTKYPYCFMTRSVYAGTQRTLKTKLGILGHTVETPQNFTHGNTSAWDNDLQSCKLTKDLVINAMQMYGEWGYRVKNYQRNPLSIT